MARLNFFIRQTYSYLTRPEPIINLTKFSGMLKMVIEDKKEFRGVCR